MNSDNMTSSAYAQNVAGGRQSTSRPIDDMVPLDVDSGILATNAAAMAVTRIHSRIDQPIGLGLLALA